jgi:hypothetical protein
MGSPAIIYTHKTVVQIYRDAGLVIVPQRRRFGIAPWLCKCTIVGFCIWSRAMEPQVMGAGGFPEGKIGFQCCVHAHPQLWHDDTIAALVSPTRTVFSRVS